MYFTQEKDLKRKVAEVFVTLDLEKNYTKNEKYGTKSYKSGFLCSRRNYDNQDLVKMWFDISGADIIQSYLIEKNSGKEYAAVKKN